MIQRNIHYADLASIYTYIFRTQLVRSAPEASKLAMQIRKFWWMQPIWQSRKNHNGDQMDSIIRTLRHTPHKKTGDSCWITGISISDESTLGP